MFWQCIFTVSGDVCCSKQGLWRWNWYRVPKRRPTTIWRRGNTQKKIYNIQITAKVWNQEGLMTLYSTHHYLPQTWWTFSLWQIPALSGACLLPSPHATASHSSSSAPQSRDPHRPQVDVSWSHALAFSGQPDLAAVGSKEPTVDRLLQYSVSPF